MQQGFFHLGGLGMSLAPLALLPDSMLNSTAKLT